MKGILAIAGRYSENLRIRIRRLNPRSILEHDAWVYMYGLAVIRIFRGQVPLCLANYAP